MSVPNCDYFHYFHRGFLSQSKSLFVGTTAFLIIYQRLKTELNGNYSFELLNNVMET